MRVALTGSPGVGKTTLARLAGGHGWAHLDLKEWAERNGAVVGHDPADGSDVIDLERLAAVQLPAGQDLLVDGHMAHALAVDVIWLVRCDPEVLRPRLEARGYARAKVQENLEAEALDIILQECLDAGPRVIQRDGTRRSSEELFTAFVEATSGSMKDHDLEPVDWSHRLPLW